MTAGHAGGKQPCGVGGGTVGWIILGGYFYFLGYLFFPIILFDVLLFIHFTNQSLII